MLTLSIYIFDDHMQSSTKKDIARKGTFGSLFQAIYKSDDGFGIIFPLQCTIRLYDHQFLPHQNLSDPIHW